MKPFRSFKAITRRELRINYRSPLVCQLSVVSSGSGSSNVGIAALLDITAVERRNGPDTLELEKLSATSIKLTWSLQDYIYSYAVYRATSPAGPFTLVTSNVIADEFTDSALAAGTYYYKVTGIEPTAGETNPSPVAGPVTTP